MNDWKLKSLFSEDPSKGKALEAGITEVKSFLAVKNDLHFKLQEYFSVNSWLNMIKNKNA